MNFQKLNFCRLSYQEMDTETAATESPRPRLHSHMMTLDSQKDLDGKLTNRHDNYSATCFCKVFDWAKLFHIRNG